MPKKVRRAELFFIASAPRGGTLGRVWRKLPVRKDGRAPWPLPGILSGIRVDPVRVSDEAVEAVESGALLSIDRAKDLPDEFNLLLFDPQDWLEPAAIVTDELIERYQAAIAYEAPLLFESDALFGPFFWKLTDADQLLDEEHLVLEFLDTVDAERRRYEKLRKRYDADQRSTPRRDRISEDVRMFVWRRDEGRCVLCGSQENLEFDHIIPFSLGGASTERNIQLLCERCNRAKGASI